MPKFLTTPVNKELASFTEDAWNDVDVSANVSAVATGAILLLEITSIYAWNLGFRKNGSSSTNGLVSLGAGRQLTVYVPLDANKIFEIFLEVGIATTDYNLWLLGYFEEEATWIDPPQSLGTISNSAYTDHDISAYTTSPAVGAITYASGYSFGCRKNGSTDDFTNDDSSAEHYRITGVDGDEVLEARDGDGTNTLFLIGYLTRGLRWNLNAVDRSTATTGSFQSVTARDGAIGHLYQSDATVSNNITVRDTAWSSFDPYKLTSNASGNQFITGSTTEQKIVAATTDLWEVGWFDNAPTVIDSTTAVGNNTNTFAVAVPTGVQAGDLLILSVINGASTTQTFTFPAAFTGTGNTATDTVNQKKHQWKWCIATGSESGNFTVTSTTTDYGVIQCVAIRGAHQTTPINADSATSDINGGTEVYPSVTTTVANTLLVCINGGIDGNSPPTVPSGFTQLEWSYTTSNYSTQQMVHNAEPDIGATGTFTCSWSSTITTAFTIAISGPATGLPPITDGPLIIINSSAMRLA